MDVLLTALGDLTEPFRLLMLVAGVVLGLVIGVIPGIGGLFGLTILIPATYTLDPASAFALLLGMASVTTTSDTIPAVLIGVPGTVGAAATVLDGHELAKQHQAARALGAAYSASLIGGVFGAHVIETAGTEDKCERAGELGAHETIDHSSEDMAKRVRELTGKKGADVVAEHVGGAVFEAGVASLARNGRLVTCGATIGGKVTLDVNVLFGKHVTLMGSWMGRRSEMLAALQHLASGALVPVVDSVLPLADARAAHERIEARAHFGKVVLVP